MKIDINCPVEAIKITMPEKDYPACDVTLFDLSPTDVVSVEITLSLLSSSGEVLQRLLYRSRDITLPSRKSYVMPVPVEDAAGCTGAQVIVEKVWFDGGSIWRRDKNGLMDIDLTPLPSSKDLDNLQAVAGKNAVMFPREEGNVWVCVCGRVNPASSARCVRCLKDKKLVLSTYSMENVQRQAKVREDQLAEETKKALEESAAQQEKEAKQKKRRKKRITAVVVSVSAVIVAAALIFAAVSFVIPQYKYSSAAKLLDEGNLQEAYDSFTALGSFRDSENMAERAEFLMAKSTIDSADMEHMSEAREKAASFIGNSNFPDAQDVVSEADYLTAKSIMYSRPEEAEQLFLNLGGYKDSKLKSTACVYIRGKALMDEGSYYEAKSLFDQIPDYAEGGDSSQTQSMECTYLMASSALDSGNIDEAIRLFSSVSSYKDSAEKLQQCYYSKAQAFQKEGKLSDAAECYLSAGDFEDAPSMAQGCFYLEGKSKLAQGSYIEAESLLSHVRDYEDGEEKWQEAAFKAAEKAMKDTEYTLALSYLEKLPEDYSTVAEMKPDCLYLPGKACMDRKDYSGAIGYFSRIPDYKDAGKLLQTSQLEYAKQLSANGKYEDAIALLEGREDKAAVGELNKTRYSYGKSLADNGHYLDAIPLFKALGNYEDSEKRLTDARYQAACQYISAGDYMNAEALLEETSGYLETDSKLKECSYLAAEEMSAEGKAAEAAEMFQKAVPYKDSESRAAALYYGLAGEAANRQDIITSARYYSCAGNYQDAPNMAAELFDAYYSDNYTRISDMIFNGEYAAAVEKLNELDISLVPENYSGFRELWNDANYFAGQECEEKGQIETAMAYYSAIGDDVRAQKRLSSNSLILIGDWVSRSGIEFSFRQDGTGTFSGEEASFVISGNTIRLNGKSEPAFRITSAGENEAVLRDLRSGSSVTLRLNRVTPRTAPTVREIKVLPTITVTKPSSSSTPVATLAPMEDIGGFTVVE